MDVLDRLLGHDAWTTRDLLRRSEELTEEQLDRRFDIEHGCPRDLFAHTVHDVEVWTDLLIERPPRNRRTRYQTGHTGAHRTTRGGSGRVAAEAREVLAAGRIDEAILDVRDKPPRKKTYGGAVTHVLTHNMHHRAHVLLVLGWLGVTDLPEGDVLGWEAAMK